MEPEKEEEISAEAGLLSNVGEQIFILFKFINDY